MSSLITGGRLIGCISDGVLYHLTPTAIPTETTDTKMADTINTSGEILFSFVFFDGCLEREDPLLSSFPLPLGFFKPPLLINTNNNSAYSRHVVRQ